MRIVAFEKQAAHSGTHFRLFHLGIRREGHEPLECRFTRSQHIHRFLGEISHTYRFAAAYGSRIRLDLAQHSFQQGGFPCAVGPNNANFLIGSNVEGKVFEELLIVAFAHALKIDHAIAQSLCGFKIDVGRNP